MENEMIDDGSLAFLDIKPDPNSVRYNCKETSQQKLVNKRFTVLGFLFVAVFRQPLYCLHAA